MATGCLFGKPLKTIAGISTNGLLNRNFLLNAVNIIHTSNLRGRLNATTVGAMPGAGGMHNVHHVVKNNSVMPILVDAGGFINGYASASDDLNMIRLMNNTGYTAVTIGANELLHGEDYLAALLPYIDFPLVNCNYSFTHPALKERVATYHVARYGQYKIGITGVGPQLPGMAFDDPNEKANETAGYLKNRLGCDLVICLSHLGFKQKNGLPDNKTFAAASKNIDAILGGDEKNIVPPQVILRNAEKRQVVVGNGGYGGSVVGSLNFVFNENRGLQNFACKNYVPGSVAGSSFYENYKKLSA